MGHACVCTCRDDPHQAQWSLTLFLTGRKKCLYYRYFSVILAHSLHLYLGHIILNCRLVMPTSTIPVHAEISTIYTTSSLVTQTSRWSELSAAFQAAYGRAPQHIVRAPGRVNIIGEGWDDL